MAATNYTPIQLYNSGTTGNAPSAGNLAAGELAINYTDGKLFYKDNSAAVQVIAWKTTPTTAGGTGLTSYTAGDLPYYASGTALSKLAIGSANYVLTSSGSVPQYVAQSTLSVGNATNAANVGTTDNTSSSSTYYPTLVSATSGNNPITTSSTKFSFVPSTGTLTTSYLTPKNPLGTAYGGTGLSGSTPFTANGILYASSASALATSSGLTFDGTNFATTGIVSATKVQTLEGVSGSIANGATATLFVLPSSGSYLVTARQDSAGNGGIRASAIVMQGTSSNGLSSLFAVGGATLVQGTGFNVDLTNTAGGSATFRWAYIKLSS
jgi:hypothetical protein